MKHPLFSFFVVASMFSLFSCERHTWEDSSEGAKDGTKRLFPKPEPKQGKNSIREDVGRVGESGDQAHDVKGR